ncbi:MAG: sigma-54-dependent Fis family transcriptional regulator, partial [Crocinitomicaceae bacterium]|nr:sigma-54-dependent Fis family transcriptional regulator [Crocinitomicaceae bacterium]
MITAFGSMEKVIKALRSGASDFLTKPFDNSVVRSIVAKLIKEQIVRTEPVNSPIVSTEISSIIGESKTFKKCLELALKAAKSDSNVLILGESGTGKEVFAKAIHENSGRIKGPFIPVNCGAIPENLIESELFGHVKGAFTGAMEAKPGKFKLGSDGSIFLDEIGETPIS